MNNLNEQQNFWANDYASEYIEKNNDFDLSLGVEGWQKMLNKTENITSVLECGCNIGRNIRFLNTLLPEAQKSIIEISKPAYDFVTSNFKIRQHFNGPIVESKFEPGSFDLTFVCGVLIHIHPDDLLSNMSKLFEYSGKYILIGEYFSRTPVMIEYQGQANKLFKQDFGKLFLQNFEVKLVDYGFLWGEIYDKGGFDDITWWLFEKK
ncbi:pseudaminic acid biosynthesis-associated methylase [Flavitalea antarctica]